MWRGEMIALFISTASMRIASGNGWARLDSVVSPMSSVEEMILPRSGRKYRAART